MCKCSGCDSNNIVLSVSVVDVIAMLLKLRGLVTVIIKEDNCITCGHYSPRVNSVDALKQSTGLCEYLIDFSSRK